MAENSFSRISLVKGEHHNWHTASGIELESIPLLISLSQKKYTPSDTSDRKLQPYVTNLLQDPLKVLYTDPV